MTDIFRGPLVQGRKERQEIPQAFVAPVLLTLFAVLAPPPGQATPVNTPQHKASYRLPADTSSGTPKTLTLDKQAPFFNVAYVSPQPPRQRVNADTTADTPLTLLAPVAAPLPPGQASSIPVHRRPWLPADTTQDMPAGLLALPVALPTGQTSFVGAPRNVFQPADTTQDVPLTILAPSAPPIPPGQAAFVSTPRAKWLNQDTTQDTPKTLVPDAQLPIGAQHLGDFKQHSRLELVPMDTTADMPLSILAPILSLPPGQVAFVAAPRRVFQPTDSTQGVPKGLVADAQLPVFNAPQFIAHRKPVAVDTSTPAFPVIRAIIVQALPPGYASSIIPPRHWHQPADSSVSVNPNIFPPATTPVVPATGDPTDQFTFTQGRNRLGFYTSTSVRHRIGFLSAKGRRIRRT